MSLEMKDEKSAEIRLFSQEPVEALAIFGFHHDLPVIFLNSKCIFP